MVEELQLSLARWRAGEWKCGAAAGGPAQRALRSHLQRRSSGLRHAVSIGRRRRQLVARDSVLPRWSARENGRRTPRHTASLLAF